MPWGHRHEGWGQPRKMGPCVSPHTHCSQLAPQQPVSATTLLGVCHLCPSPGHQGSSGQGHLLYPALASGQTHLQVCPGLAQHIMGPGHCEGERDGVSEVPVLWSHLGTKPAWLCHPAAGCHLGHVRWLTMNCSMLSLSWAVLRSRSAVFCRASSLSESWARSAAISPCSACSWHQTSVMSGERASSPTGPANTPAPCLPCPGAEQG